MGKKLVKQDINCLEYPLWFQDNRSAEHHETGYTWNNAKGFVVSTNFKPPVKTDIIFLFYLLNKSQEEGWKDEIRVTRYQVIKECGLAIGALWYKRLEESLKRWERMNIEFNGCFYDGKEYTTMHFGVVDSWSIEKGTKLLRVRFSPEYLLVVKNTTYFKYIDFDQFKTLRSSLATRLYQILIKTFLDRSVWEIDSILLAKKIPMKEQYAAQVVKKIKPAVNHISKHTDLKITVEERKQCRGKIILVFKKEAGKLRKLLVETAPTGFVMPDNEELKKLIAILPPERQDQKSLLELVAEAFNERGFDYVAWNIKYANKRARGNYIAYFKTALQGNFGELMKEEEEVQRKSFDISKQAQDLEAQVQKIKMTEVQAKEEQESAQILEVLKSLSPEEREIIDQEAFKRLPSFMQQSFKEARQKNSIAFASTVRALIQEKLKGSKKLSQQVLESEKEKTQES